MDNQWLVPIKAQKRARRIVRYIDVFTVTILLLPTIASQNIKNCIILS